MDLVKLSGGKCIKCGYDKNIASLEFHHKEEATKNFPLDARHLSNTSWCKILVEFDKCELLCSNCHREHHNPELFVHIMAADTSLPWKAKIRTKAVHKCVDCNVEVSSRADRCRTCKSIYQRKADRPEKELLLKQIEEHGYAHTGRLHGVTDNTIRRWVRMIFYKKGGVLDGVRKIPVDMKKQIQPYLTSSSKYKPKSGIVVGLRKPNLASISPKASGVSFGADKDGFFVYTHRARSKSHKDPMDIPSKEIIFIESTG